MSESKKKENSSYSIDVEIALTALRQEGSEPRGDDDWNAIARTYCAQERISLGDEELVSVTASAKELFDVASPIAREIAVDVICQNETQNKSNDFWLKLAKSYFEKASKSPRENELVATSEGARFLFKKMRALGRVLAVQAMYQEEVNRVSDEEWDELIASYDEEMKTSTNRLEKEGALEFARFLYKGTLERRDAIDSAISNSLNKRTLKRTTLVDRNILRVAVYEIYYTKTNKVVVISEAIRIASMFGEQGSIGFINGVLDHLDASSL